MSEISAFTHLVIWSSKKASGNNVTLCTCEAEARELAETLREGGNSTTVCKVLDWHGENIKTLEER